MGLKARLSSNCTKRANNGVDLVTSSKINTRLARPISAFAKTYLICTGVYLRFILGGKIWRTAGHIWYVHINTLMNSQQNDYKRGLVLQLVVI